MPHKIEGILIRPKQQMINWSIRKPSADIKAENEGPVGLDVILHTFLAHLPFWQPFSFGNGPDWHPTLTAYPFVVSNSHTKQALGGTTNWSIKEPTDEKLTIKVLSTFNISALLLRAARCHWKATGLTLIAVLWQEDFPKYYRNVNLTFSCFRDWVSSHAFRTEDLRFLAKL